MEWGAGGFAAAEQVAQPQLPGTSEVPTMSPEVVKILVPRAHQTIAAAVVACTLFLGTASAQLPALRICGDPDNLPFSNEKLEGFENKIASTIAADLGATLLTRGGRTSWPRPQHARCGNMRCHIQRA